MSIESQLKYAVHPPAGLGLLESSMASLSCCMKSARYRALSFQMFSSLSMGFLQLPSASLQTKGVQECSQAQESTTQWRRPASIDKCSTIINKKLNKIALVIA